MPFALLVTEGLTFSLPLALATTNKMLTKMAIRTDDKR